MSTCGAQALSFSACGRRRREHRERRMRGATKTTAMYAPSPLTRPRFAQPPSFTRGEGPSGAVTRNSKSGRREAVMEINGVAHIQITAGDFARAGFLRETSAVPGVKSRARCDGLLLLHRRAHGLRRQRARAGPRRRALRTAARWAASCVLSCALTRRCGRGACIRARSWRVDRAWAASGSMGARLLFAPVRGPGWRPPRDQPCARHGAADRRGASASAWLIWLSVRATLPRCARHGRRSPPARRN